MAKVLMCLPKREFDPTESGVPWQVLSAAGHRVEFATEDGSVAACDPKTLTGTGLGPFGPFLGSKSRDADAYRQMEADPQFQSPAAWADVDASTYDALLIPGGHAQGMRPMLESAAVQQIIVSFFQRDAPVATVCHGVLAVARAVDPQTGRSVLYGRRTTGLNNLLERISIVITRPFVGGHYRTYPITVQDEVKAVLESPEHWSSGPIFSRYATPKNPDVGFIVQDGNYVSARWPGDVQTWARRFLQLVEQASTAHVSSPTESPAAAASV